MALGLLDWFLETGFLSLDDQGYGFLRLVLTVYLENEKKF